MVNNARATLKKVCRFGHYEFGCPRRYVRVVGEYNDLSNRVNGWKSCFQDEPTVVVFSVKPWYLRWFARELSKSGAKILRWKTPLLWGM